MSQSAGGFLTIDDVIQRLSTNIIHVPGEEREEVKKYLEKLAENESIVIDLRLGKEFFLSRSRTPSIFVEGLKEYLTIEPGEFAILTTYEKFEIPLDLFAFISMKFRHSLKGLINISGFHVDPGYRGRIIYSVYNAGPNRINLKYREKVFMIIFTKLGKEVKPLKNKQFQDVDTIQPVHMQGLSSQLPLSLQSLDKRILKLENLKTALGVLVTIAGAIAGIFVALIYGVFNNG